LFVVIINYSEFNEKAFKTKKTLLSQKTVLFQKKRIKTMFCHTEDPCKARSATTRLLQPTKRVKIKRKEKK